MIRFLHRDAEVFLEDAASDTTVLDYLREDCQLTGTKEGCASGDCGACTVVTANATEDGLRYDTLNACIAPLGSLHGKQLITVEDLRDGDVLHPVQQAMVDCHGSQCGFCTPGFVMSLFRLFHDEEATGRHAILEALGGNLCRCTGYRPIIAAAEQALALPREDRFSRDATATVQRLRALEDAEDVALQRGEQRYFRPATSADVAALLEAYPDARIVAGGTDLLLEVTQNLTPLPQLIDVVAVPELSEISVDEHIHLGAAVSHQQSLAAVLTDYPELKELMERFGSLQIRSQGTVAGNVANASPIGDWPPVLLALDASLRLESSDGKRDMSVDEFFLDYRKTALKPGEFIHSVILPRRREDLFLRAYKISKRFEDDISSVCAVFALRFAGEVLEEVRIAFGGMAAVPKRAVACEEALSGKPLTTNNVNSACKALATDFQPITDARASADYRLRVAQNLLQRLLLEWGTNVETRVHPAAEAAHG